MASKRRIRRKACGSKRKFNSEQEAINHALAVKRHTGTKAFVSAYRCTFCHHWHWGNKHKGVISSVGTKPQFSCESN